MKKVLIIVGAVLLAGLIAAGSFWAGMAYQTNKTEQARANFFNARGQLREGQFPQEGQMPGGGQFFREEQLPGSGQGAGFFGRGGTFGQVKDIDGNVITISTAQDVTTVNLSDTTQIEKTVSGSVNDLQPGTRVTVIGQTEKDGSINASRIQILSENAVFPPDNPPPGTEP